MIKEILECQIYAKLTNYGLSTLQVNPYIIDIDEINKTCRFVWQYNNEMWMGVAKYVITEYNTHNPHISIMGYRVYELEFHYPVERIWDAKSCDYVWQKIN